MSALTDRVGEEHRAVAWEWRPDRVYCACSPEVSRMRVAYARHVARETEDALLAEDERLREGMSTLIGDLDTARAEGVVWTYGGVQRRLRALIAATPGEPGAGRHAHGAWCVTDCPDMQATRDGGER